LAEAAADGGYSTPILRAIPDAGLAVFQCINGDWQCFRNAANAVAGFAAKADTPEWIAAFGAEAAAQAALLRDVFGNPFRRLPRINRAWLSWRGGRVVDLARGAYRRRLSRRLASLADALEEAGCTNRRILDHCRTSGMHVRGCWVLDLVLRKNRSSRTLYLDGGGA
jgi:hypothetical protein